MAKQTRSNRKTSKPKALGAGKPGAKKAIKKSVPVKKAAKKRVVKKAVARKTPGSQARKTTGSKAAKPRSGSVSRKSTAGSPGPKRATTKKGSARSSGRVASSAKSLKKRSATGTGKKTVKKTTTPTAKRPSRVGVRPLARSATVQDPIQFPEDSRKMPKTHLRAKELREFKALLLLKRRELAGDVRHMSRDALSKGRGFADKPSMPIHMADVGTDNWEQEFTLGLIESEQGRIRQIDEALDRIVRKTYGVCVATFKPISTARLRAKPWAKYCIDYARAREEGRVR